MGRSCRSGFVGPLPKHSSLTHLVLTTEHQSPSGTDANTIATIHTGGIRQRCRKLGRDARVKATPSHRNSKSILRIGPAGFHAFITEDAAGIVANVQVIINLHRLCDGGRSRSIWRMMMAGMAMISLSACGSRRAKPLRMGTVPLHVVFHRRRNRRSTDEARNSRTRRRLRRTRSESVCTTMPFSALT